ncbi:MAG: hypothetical protein HY907_20990 [Deltaproteobacteria bacterium]|nr:hypothetical protein [Deltaproteobacteria bacterium]
MSRIRLFVVGGLALAALSQGACSGCNEEYYCDESGCYWCDSYGCRPVDPPPAAECSHGDWECPSDRPLCTEAGFCVAECTADSDCPAGLRCVGARCLEPVTDECVVDTDCDAAEHCADGVCVPNDHPGTCTTDAECAAGEVCSGSGNCLPAGTDACAANPDCAAGEVCDIETHECVPAPTDGGTDGPPPPPPQCLSNADCPTHYLCIDAVCKLPCTTDAQCGLGCSCVGGFCSEPPP